MAEWTKERKEKAVNAIKERAEAKKIANTKSRMRVPLGAKRDILNVQNTPAGFKDRMVNDVDGRIERFKEAGYELVEDAQLGTSHVDGTQADSGVVSKDVGRGVTGYLMRQREDHFIEDQAAKQRDIDETESAMRRNVKSNQSTDGTYGEVKIGQSQAV